MTTAKSRTADLVAFLNRTRRGSRNRWTAVSLFSGAGLSDMGYELAGFRFRVQVEADPDRAALGQDNFPHSTWITGDVRKVLNQVVEAYRDATERRLDLLVATPPCQGMSSSNPSRGKRQNGAAKANEEKNRLILELIPYARRLRPRVIVAENVRPVLTLTVTHDGREGLVINFLREGLKDYEVFEGVVNVADYGVPQARKRAIIVAVHRDESWLDDLLGARQFPWPSPTHADRANGSLLPWVTVREWFEAVGYPHLDAKDEESARSEHPLHFVPHYLDDRYLQVSHIPPYSGRSAYQNDTCPDCGVRSVPEGLATCPACGATMRNRPYVVDEAGPRLVAGFKSSYRRMHPDRPAPVVTTNSSHVGSDFKIHPWENRVLSILEVADLQTVPRSYKWDRAFETKRPYLIRRVIGEAFPPYFTYLHGRLLGSLLSSKEGRTTSASLERTAARRHRRWSARPGGSTDS